MMTQRKAGTRTAGTGKRQLVWNRRVTKVKLLAASGRGRGTCEVGTWHSDGRLTGGMYDILRVK